MSKWYWGLDGCESYNGPFDSKKEAFDEAKSEYPEVKTFLIGEATVIPFQVNADNIICLFSESDDLYCDAFDGWCEDVPQEKMDKLSEAINKVCIEHLTMWGEQTEWNVIYNPDKVTNV